MSKGNVYNARTKNFWTMEFVQKNVKIKDPIDWSTILQLL